jgi:hypothetical protein
MIFRHVLKLIAKCFCTFIERLKKCEKPRIYASISKLPHGRYSAPILKTFFKGSKAAYEGGRGNDKLN